MIEIGGIFVNLGHFQRRCDSCATEIFDIHFFQILDSNSFQSCGLNFIYYHVNISNEILSKYYQIMFLVKIFSIWYGRGAGWQIICLHMETAKHKVTISVCITSIISYNAPTIIFCVNYCEISNGNGILQGHFLVMSKVISL